MTPKTENLTPAEVASMLGISRRTLDRWHALRVGPPRLKIGRTVLFRTESIDAWLKANETAPKMTFHKVKP